RRRAQRGRAAHLLVAARGADGTAAMAGQFLGRCARCFQARGGAILSREEEGQMNEQVTIAPVRKTVHVKATVEHCFEVFTSGLTRWWPHDHTVGKKPIKKVMLEPRLGGRWLEIAEDGTETTDATIIVWDPPHRFVILWQINAQWQPDLSMKSEV